MAGRSPQSVPVRVYQSDDLVMIAAPMPGLEPQNISLQITGDQVTIQGQERGPRQHDRDLTLAEWTVGPYYREVKLPHPVDATRANATYGNGVLALAIPKASADHKGSSAEIRLRPIGSTRGEYVTHTGHDRRAMSTVRASRSGPAESS